MRSSRERNAATTHPRRCRSSRTMGEFYLMTRKRLRRQVVEFVDVRGFDDSQLKDGELLAKGEVLEHQTAVRPKPAKHGSEPEPKQVKHGNHVIADRLCRLPCEVIDFTAGQDCDEGQSRPETGLLI